MVWFYKIQFGNLNESIFILIMSPEKYDHSDKYIVYFLAD